MITIIKSMFDFLDGEIIISLYTALVEPNLEYGNIIRIIMTSIPEWEPVAIEKDENEPSEL